ncbi:MAG: hypothetical protein LZF62_180034 [Nitrospira sp.]|nr:MAG: hypothetical protein LZF62_180034 [Nitrospira sp.]
MGSKATLPQVQLYRLSLGHSLGASPYRHWPGPFIARWIKGMVRAEAEVAVSQKKPFKDLLKIQFQQV